MTDLKSCPRSLEILELLSEAMGKKEDADQQWLRYKNFLSRSLWGWFKDEELVGLLGVEKSDREIRILHIAVQKPHRFKSLGRTMIKSLIQFYPDQKIIAETDLDSVGFYRKLGFDIQNLEEKFPVKERFLCSLEI